MKNLDCFQIREGLKDIKQIPFSELSGMGEDKMQYLFHTDFVLACARNKKLIDDHITILEDIKKPSKEYEKYQEEKRNIAREFSKKDENGNPITVTKTFADGSYTESYIIPEFNNMDTPYNKAVIKLDKKYDALIQEQKAKDLQFEKVIFEDCDIKLHMMRSSILPKVGLSVLSAEALLFMIEEESAVNNDKPK